MKDMGNGNTGCYEQKSTRVKWIWDQKPLILNKRTFSTVSKPIFQNGRTAGSKDNRVYVNSIKQVHHVVKFRIKFQKQTK